MMLITNIILLFGGVALFLFGMSFMGDGLKKCAGSKLELVLYKLSDTPLKGVLLGTGVTAVIQSSSATSVMVVGFVNSNMMSLSQAIPIIMGSVVGTSITAWVICVAEIGSIFSAQTISASMAVLGILIKMFSKNKKAKQIGEIILGFAVLMIGLKTMTDAVMPLKNEPVFTKILMGFKHPMLGIFIGILIAAVLQSASAAVGIIQALSGSGALTFEIALPIIMGISIGASVPLIIASFESTTEGKKAAFAYPVIEILRVIIFASVFYISNGFLSFSIMHQTVDMFSIALLNTMFRLSTVLILLPFIPVIEKIVSAFFKVKKEESDINRLEEKFLAYPSLAVEQSRLVINSMASQAEESIITAIKLFDEYSDREFDKVAELEKSTDRYEDKLGSYLITLSGHEMDVEQNHSVGMYLKTITDFERMADHALNISERAAEMNQKKISFTSYGTRELAVLSEAIKGIVKLTIECFINNKTDDVYRVEPLEQVIDELCKQIKENHIQRLQKGLCTIALGYILNDLLTDYERISDHCSNIAAAIIETGKGSMNMHVATSDIKDLHMHKFDEYYREFYEKYFRI